MKTNQTELCQICDDEYKNLSMHWNQSSTCDYQKLTNKQVEIITGVLMGDGTISRPGVNPLLGVAVIREEYLEYLDEKLGKYGKGVIKRHTAEEAARTNRDSGYRPNADKEDYHDIYCLQTRTSPEFEQFQSWYESGEKRFPKNVDLTPTVLKHWYVCDGHYNKNGAHDNISIASKNEQDRMEEIVGWFDDIGFNAKITNYHIRFSNEESSELFEYMGDSLPGFNYKWP